VRDRGFRWALTLDGDGQHAAEDIPSFFACAEKTGASLVIGDRMGCCAAMPWLRRQVNRWMTRRLARLTGVPLADSQCGFRLINLEAWSGLTVTTERFEVESEMLAAFLAAGHPVRFVPVRVIYKPHPSKIHPLADTWRWVRWWVARQGWGQRALTFLGVVVLLAAFYGWASPRAYPRDTRFGFGYGVLHGALMPMALPSLVMGQDVEIFAAHNLGRSYKLGYIVGINLCGLLFFGSAFWRSRGRDRGSGPARAVDAYKNQVR
jgi:hypothetical protein